MISLKKTHAQEGTPNYLLIKVEAHHMNIHKNINLTTSTTNATTSKLQYQFSKKVGERKHIKKLSENLFEMA